MADKIVRAQVEGDRPVFINGVLHMPGEEVAANLTELGVTSLDDKEMVGLKASSAKTREAVVDVPIAAVAPHAPDAPNPQGIAPGTVQSGTGRLVTPADSGEDQARSPVGADSERAAQVEKPVRPTKRK